MPNLSAATHVAPLPLIVLGAFAAIGLLGLIVIAWLAIAERIEETRFPDQFEFAPGPIDRGAALPDFVNQEALRNLASHHKLEELPSQIQETNSRKIKGGAPKGTFGGEKGQETKVTREPRDDPGELIHKVVRHLYDNDELNQTVDRILLDDMIDAIPNFADPESAREAFQAWFEEKYPEGFDGVDPAQLAEQLARLGQEFPQGKVCERLKSSFESVQADQPEAPLYVEGEWAVKGENESVILSRTNLRVQSIGPLGAQERSIPMPEGASIVMKLPEGELTSHGQNRMVGVSRPVRATVLGTLKNYDPETGCFQLVPIAVYQRIGNS